MAGEHPGIWFLKTRFVVGAVLGLASWGGMGEAVAAARTEGRDLRRALVAGDSIPEFAAFAAHRPQDAGLDAGGAFAVGGGALPTSVDNSALPAFPPLFDQGDLESCTAVVSTYYQLTHATGLLRGWDQSRLSARSRFSPAWTYNLTNEGANLGVSLSRAYLALAEHGAVTLERLPYRGAWSGAEDPGEAGGAGLHDEALANRISGFGVVDAHDPARFLDELKRWLSEGHLLTGSTAIEGWNRVAVATPPGEAPARHHGEWICTEIDPGAPVSHAITIVGYDDDIWFDLDGDGLAGPGERGAFKIVNSWGSRDWNAGFRWLHYTAVVPGASADGVVARRGAFWGDRLYWLLPGGERPADSPAAGYVVAVAHLAEDASAGRVPESD